MGGKTSANIGETAPASDLPGQMTTKYWWCSAKGCIILLTFAYFSGVSVNLDLRVNSAKTRRTSHRKFCHQGVRTKIQQNLKNQKQMARWLVWDRQREKRDIRLFQKNWEIPWKNSDDEKTSNFSSKTRKSLRKLRHGNKFIKNDIHSSYFISLNCSGGAFNIRLPNPF